LEVRRRDEPTVSLYWHCGEDMSEEFRSIGIGSEERGDEPTVSRYWHCGEDISEQFRSIRSKKI
jgi:hypothetical protein